MKRERFRITSGASENEQPEKILHRKLCSYLKENYPEVYFFSDPSGLRVTPGLRIQLQQTHSAHPQLDLVILEPSLQYKALVLELKAESPYKKNGELLKSDHLEKQLKTMNFLKSKGYHCLFAWTEDMARAIFNEYLGLPVIVPELSLREQFDLM